MKKTIFLFVLLAVGSLQAAGVCMAPQDIDAPINPKLKLSCLPEAYFLKTPVQDLSLENILKGPVIREVAFKSDETVYCRYFYRPQNGSSNKFRCYRTNEKNELYSDKGTLIPTAVKVGTGELDEILLDSQNKPILNAKGNPYKADILKVRFQDGSNRHRENFASTVASRFSWIMGVPMENYYSVKTVTCFGCEKNPWNEGLNPQKTYKPGIQNHFDYAGIERKFEAKRIMKPNDKFSVFPWTWGDFGANVDKMSREQRIEFETLALVANFLQVIEHRGAQHTVLCEDEFYNKETKVCSKALAAIHDMGSAFGSRTSIDPATNNHPRADFAGYKKSKMFNGCQTGYNKPELKFKPFLSQSFAEFKSRLQLLNDKQIIKEILRIAYFQYADLKFRSESKIKNPKMNEAELNEYILDQWTDLIMSKINENLEIKC